MPKQLAPKRVAAKTDAPQRVAAKRLAPKPRGGSGAFRPTPEQRQMVEALAGWGVAVADIARSVAPGGLTPANLRRHFADELGQGRTKADAAIAETLIEQARQGNVAACKLWIERAGCSSVAPNACPPIRHYDDEFTAAFADQVQALPLPQYWAVMEALADYYVLRRQAEACR